ncbi:MAG: 4Fe-4S dicluster domain-containing protein [Ruminococcus sp.]|nr:4Fe-4S dicluster domain-containing protein [Ruminococcus sp.]
MKVILEILRRESREKAPYVQKIIYETDDENETVATALNHINNRGDYKDTDNNPVTHIHWECSCMQEKCGACAMIINSKPRLACGSKLKDMGETVKIQPLKKFPAVADLTVDRSIMLENIKTAGLWFEESTKADETVGDISYEASRCLQCGCCLEVCPNFYTGGEFFGMSAAVPLTRIISAVTEKQKKDVYKAYKKHIYEGCGKSLACHDICPANIDIEKLLVNSNGAAVWKRHIGKKKK